MKAVLPLMFTAVLLGCMDTAEHDALTPDVITLGVLPGQSPDQLAEQYDPLVRYLEEWTSLEFDLVIPEDYESMLDDFVTHRVDIANLGGFTFTEAERRHNAEPLVMRDVDLNFASCYLVPSADVRQSIHEFEGETFSFGPQLSTSGHVMPRYFLETNGIDPETFFASVRYSSGHDETAKWIRDGVVAVGVTNCIVIESMILDDRLRRDELRILETTPAYANYVWAVSEQLSTTIKTQVRDAFLDLDPTHPEHQEILQKLGANAYLPASRSDFDSVRRAVGMTTASSSHEH